MKVRVFQIDIETHEVIGDIKVVSDDINQLPKLLNELNISPSTRFLWAIKLNDVLSLLANR